MVECEQDSTVPYAARVVNFSVYLDRCGVWRQLGWQINFIFTTCKDICSKEICILAAVHFEQYSADAEVSLGRIILRDNILATLQDFLGSPIPAVP